MRITNKYGLPEAIVNAVQQRKASDGRISVTSLIDSPQIRQLVLDHWDELEDDASDRLWALMGNLFHDFLKTNSNNSFVEEELISNVNGQLISCRTDIMEDGGIISDWKVVSVWHLKFGLKANVEKQLNCYAYIWRKSSFDVTKLQAHLLLRDWTLNEKLRYNDYPPIPFQTVEVPLWTKEEQYNYITRRIAFHTLPPADKTCTDEERWRKPNKLAIMKEGRKTAVRVFDSVKEAEKHMDENKLDNKHSIVVRPGGYTRCENYCIVSKFCPQWAKEKPKEPLTEE